MKLNKLIAAVALLSSSVAFAADHTLELDLNSGLLIESYDDGATKNKHNEDMKFAFDHARMGLKGKLSDTFSYRIKWDFLKVPNNTGVDGANDNVKLAYVDHKMGDATFRFGRQKLRMCGWENSTSSRDVYHDFETSACKAVSMSKYASGISYNRSMGDHMFGFYFGNHGSTAASYENAGTMNLFWDGKFMDGALAAGFNYTSTKTTETLNATGTELTKSVNDTNMGVNLGYTMAGLWIGFDYIQNTDKSTQITPAVDDIKTTSMALHVRYTAGQYTPYFAFESSKMGEDTDQIEGVGAAFDEKTGMFLGVEYKHDNDTDHTYYISYGSNTYKDGTSGATTDDLKDGSIMIGFAMGADIGL